jgi:hypothetical protein
MFSQVLTSLRDRHLSPPMMGSGGYGGPISRRVLAVRLAVGIGIRNGLASSIVLAGTSLHRSAPCHADRSRCRAPWPARAGDWSAAGGASGWPARLHMHPVGTGQHASSVQCRAHHCDSPVDLPSYAGSHHRSPANPLRPTRCTATAIRGPSNALYGKRFLSQNPKKSPPGRLRP